MILPRRLFPVLAMVIAVLAFGVPAAASNAHRLAHVEAPETGHHHHHGALPGDVETHDDQSDDRSDADRKEKGVAHSHEGTVAGDMLATETNQPFVLLPVSARPFAWSVHRLTTRAWTPHQRPPRTA